MENLLEETLRILKANDKRPDDVLWVGVIERDYGIPAIKQKEFPLGSWADFERLANFAYDNGYGGAEINDGLKIVGHDWWLERGEYDGSEWWEFKTLPPKPTQTTPLRESDLKED